MNRDSRDPAFTPDEALVSLARLVASYLERDRLETLSSKQGVAGSNPVSRSTPAISRAATVRLHVC